MLTDKETGKGIRSGIFDIPPCLIKPNPALSRTEFSDTSLVSLADSIRRYGILQPLAVRLSEKGKYELIAGERRLRAAMLLSLRTVPCVIVGTEEKYEFLSVVENIHREGLGMFDEARAIRRLYEKHGRNASKTAALLSFSESELCERLRLCEFSRAEMQALDSLGVGMRDALLYLGVPQVLRFYTIKLCAEKGLSGTEASALCSAIATEKGLTPDELESFAVKFIEGIRAIEKEESTVPTEEPQSGRRTIFLRDLRAFEISLSKTCATLERAGFSADIKTEKDGEKTVYTICVEQRKKKG
ncbi:MAG: ParB/RepB/Spo0J family partition protein [Clostridia bacterium]|nr:ParB/RepB/Spo0J family partition protein [Clostridia bacterium]